MFWAEPVEVTAEEGGTVQDVDAVEGEIVSWGETLITLESTGLQLELQNAELELRAAQTLWEILAVALEETEGRHLNDAATDAELVTARTELDTATVRMASAELLLESTRRSLERTLVRGPRSGLVTEVRTRVGELVAPDTIVVVLQDASAPATSIRARWPSGQPTPEPSSTAELWTGDLLVETVSFSHAEIVGEVVWAFFTFTASARRTPAWAGFPVQLRLSSSESVLVPALLVEASLGSGEVLVATDVGSGQVQLTWRTVTLGTREGGFVPVTSGLAPGELLVVPQLPNFPAGSIVVHGGASLDVPDVP